MYRKVTVQRAERTINISCRKFDHFLELFLLLFFKKIFALFWFLKMCVSWDYEIFFGEVTLLFCIIFSVVENPSKIKFGFLSKFSMFHQRFDFEVNMAKKIELLVKNRNLIFRIFNKKYPKWQHNFTNKFHNLKTQIFKNQNNAKIFKKKVWF